MKVIKNFTIDYELGELLARETNASAIVNMLLQNYYQESAVETEKQIAELRQKSKEIRKKMKELRKKQHERDEKDLARLKFLEKLSFRGEGRRVELSQEAAEELINLQRKLKR